MKVTRLVAPNPGPFTGEGTNSYILESGGAAIAIDPGPLIASHLDAIRAALRATELVGIAVTHHHLDHVPAANPLAAEYDVPTFGYGDYGGFQAISAVADGDVIRIGAEVIEVLNTPGHTPDSMSFAIDEGVFAGDTVKSGSTVVVEDMAEYMATLDRLAALRPVRIYPGHGAVIDYPAATLSSYIAHRLERERQVLNHLETASRSLADLVRAIYPDLDPALLVLAQQSAQAHLRKLEADGLATRDEQGWRLPA